MMRCTLALTLTMILSALPSTTHAGVVLSSNVVIAGNPYSTFVDTNSGLTWLRVDNFWNPTDTYNSIVTTLTGSGFHLATFTDLTGLQTSIPAISANFASEVSIVGGNYLGRRGNAMDRDLMWGIYEDGFPGDGVSYSWKYGSDDTFGWSYTGDVIEASTTLQSVNSDNQDLGAWVVSNNVLSTPESASVAVWGVGLATVGFATYWRRRFA